MDGSGQIPPPQEHFPSLWAQAGELHVRHVPDLLKLIRIQPRAASPRADVYPQPAQGLTLHRRGTLRAVQRIVGIEARVLPQQPDEAGAAREGLELPPIEKEPLALRTDIHLNTAQEDFPSFPVQGDSVRGTSSVGRPLFHA